MNCKNKTQERNFANVIWVTQRQNWLHHLNILLQGC